MSSFIPNKNQKKAFDSVVRAFEKARRSGLIFYGKSDNLVAYTKEANEYIENDFEKSTNGIGSQIPCISATNCINDSGADDYGYFISIHDEQEHIKI